MIGTKIAGDIDSARQYRNRENMDKNSSSNGQNHSQKLDKSRDNDYFASLNYDYILNEKQNLSLYYGYTLSGDSDFLDYKNYSSFSIGTGYLFTQNWYSALSYNYTGSIYRDGDAMQSVEWFNSYSFTKNIFASIGYSYALDDISYDNTLSLILGFRF